MAKFKPHKGLRKRTKVTAKKKVKAQRPFKSHLNSSFSGTRVRQLRRSFIFGPEYTKRSLFALGEG
jgi:ribosomal protein L35